MWIVELLVVLLFIWFGARLGSIGIGYAGGFGVLVLSVVFGLKPGDIPFDVILIHQHAMGCEGDEIATSLDREGLHPDP